MRSLQAMIAFFGRMLISIIFVSSSIHKILQWQASESGLISLIYDWQSYVSYSFALQRFFGALASWVPFILGVVTTIEFICGFMLLLGIKPKFAVFLLLLVFVPITILFHQFWFLEGIRREMQITIFLKNIAIIGGMLLVMTIPGKLPKKNSIPNISLENPSIDE